jgi:hypothetical protein
MNESLVLFYKKEPRAGLAGRPRAKERKRFFLKKEAKTSVHAGFKPIAR